MVSAVDISRCTASEFRAPEVRPLNPDPKHVTLGSRVKGLGFRVQGLGLLLKLKPKPKTHLRI